MCTNIKEIYNKYTRQTMYVKCGKCIPCLQEKAFLRANRIRNNIDGSHTALFFHLTYADAYIPYVKMDELLLNSQNFVSVYRDHDAHYYYNRGFGYSLPYSTLGGKVLDMYYNRDLHPSELELLHDIGHRRVGVLYYKDIQDFFKRLRNNLNRDTKYKGLVSVEDDLSYFVCGEYGENCSRPHWHVLLYVPTFNQQSTVLGRWCDVVCKSWLYAFDFVTRNRFEVAIDAATYAASYVNSSADISPFLRRDDFRPVWHYSHGFGTGIESLSLPSILQKIDNGDLRHLLSYHLKDGSLANRAVPFPKYVLNRYFPVFKGRFRLSDDELGAVVRDPRKLYQYKSRLDLSDDDLRGIIIRLDNCFARCRLSAGRSFSRSDYSYYYVRFMRLSVTNNFRMMYDDIVDASDIFQRYDNIFKVLSSKKFYLLNSFGFWLERCDDDYIVHPNDFQRNKLDNDYLNECYFKYVKQKKFNVLAYGKCAERPVPCRQSTQVRA